jgi:glycosyltransferase involved in cell wall biosynthesis
LKQVIPDQHGADAGGMKVLYLLGNYPKVSETYVAAEIRFMVRMGVRIEVFAPSGGCPGARAEVPVHRGRIDQALQAFQPDLVHVHYLVVHHDAIDVAGRSGVPATIRGHSFDFSAQAVFGMAGRPWVRRIYLFPHFADAFSGNNKVMAMPVAYETDLYYPEDKERRLVLRTAAAKPNKGLSDFIEAASLCTRHRFVLAVDPVEPSFMPVLRDQAAKSGRIELLENVPNEEAARLTRKAGIYLDTSDPGGHLFGMPISIAESMAAGAYVLVRDSAPARAYIGDGGRAYQSAQEAAAIINETAAWSDSEWHGISARAVLRARAFSSEAVLPRMLSDWKAITGK